MLSNLTDWVIDVIAALSYLGVALLVALENLFPPIPSEVVLPFAGFVARDGEANLVGMIAAATVGSMLGAWALYGIAAAIGPDRLEALVVAHGRWVRLTVQDLEKAERWFDRRAVVAVLVGRCVPLIRSLVSIPAGFRRMSLPVFSLYTLAGSLVWNTALIGAGYLLRDQWDSVEPIISWFQYLVIALILGFLVRFALSRFRSPSGSGRARDRRARAQGEGSEPGPASDPSVGQQPSSRPAMTASSKVPGGSGAPSNSSRRRMPPST
jgi:membrane protein DedA with SNARE-associated domain